MKQLYTSVSGQGNAIVLLHGMAASSRYWDGLVPLLSKKHQVIAVDLLGFGRSPKPHLTYSYDAHTKAITQTLKHLKVSSPITVVGHSMGALIALRLAREHPELIKKVVMIGSPIYASPKQARAEITNGRLLPRLAYYGPTSQVLCTLWCRILRPLSGRLAPLYLPYLTPPIARDSVLHTWHSYNSSMQQIIERQAVLKDINACVVPLQYIYGKDDTAAQPERMGDISKVARLSLATLPGDHQVVLQQPKPICELIQQIA